MKSSIVLINNPTAKQASDKKIAQASHFLVSRGYHVEVLSTCQRGDAESFAQEAIEKSPSLIIAAGGDGTINEVVNGMVGSEIPLAILPLGTTNVLAKEINIPENVKGALEIAVSSIPQIISLGRIIQTPAAENERAQKNHVTHRSSLVTRYFVLMAGIGFDGEAVFGINETFKKFSGKGTYICSGLKTLSKFNPGKLTFDINGKTYSGYSAIIGNAAKYGGNFKITPDAKLTDPFFYICLFKGRNRLDIIRYLFGIVLGKHLRFKDVEYIKATDIEVKGDAHVQIDGDYFGMTPVKVEIVPDVLRLVF
ncbi:MAG: diacylglycerol kinase family lipid kinase [Nitrospirota bacterium]|nr:diacylglycerol kinase family lipid kinase [Nitrospirota bacterium]MDH5767555.1 diacylglycerol kinase family lipid kinase [Nitrospirota bacterium]